MNNIRFTVFDPATCGFPEPTVPYLPRFTPDALRSGWPEPDFAFVGEHSPKRSYTRGRYALYDAYRLAGVGAEGCLLAPAYHCRTMLDPAARLGGNILLYKLGADLAPDLASISQLVAHAPLPVRALLVTHYFGFAQRLEAIKAFCVARGITLIEDCSHALFNLRARPQLGGHGDFTIASPYKLFPCEEGGLLIARDPARLPRQPNRAAGLKAELRTLKSAVQRSRNYPRPEALERDCAGLDGRIAAFDPLRADRGREYVDQNQSISRMYDAREEGQAGTFSARWLMRRVDLGHVTSLRRAHYRAWLECTASLPHCRPLFPVLPDDTVPYMFPLYIEHPDPHFFALKRLGMPIWRWDEMAISDCALSRRYRLRVLHLPCHQSLSPAELRWMMGAVTKVLRQVPVLASPPTDAYAFTADAAAADAVRAA